MQTYSDAQTALLPVPEGFHPEGIEEAHIERIFDENTLYLLQALPTQQYRAIFAHLIRYATLDPRSSMQLSLFEVIGEGRNEAIILYRSTDELSKMGDSPAGPDTYGRAVILYESLHLCQRKFHRGYTELRIPLGKRDILIPDLLKSLRQAHSTYRDDKVQQLLRKMAGILRSGEFLARIPRPAVDPQAKLKTVLLQLLAEHGIEKGNVRLPSLTQACTILAEAAKSGRVPLAAGEFLVLPSQQSRGQVGDSVPGVGEFPNTGKKQPVPSQEEENARVGEFPNTESPAFEKKWEKRRRWSVKKGDLDAIFGTKSPDKAPTGEVRVISGDSPAGLSISVITSSSVISLENIDTLNDTPPATNTKTPYEDPRPSWEIQEEVKEYRRRFDQGKSNSWRGSLYDVIRETPPSIRLLAEIATVFYGRFGVPGSSKPMYSPGGFFTRSCQLYRDKKVPTPAEIKIWSESGLSLDEIRTQIQVEGKRHPAQMVLEESAAPEVALEEEAFPEEEYQLPRTPRVQESGRGWMRQGEAESLCARILREGQRFAIQAEVLPGELAGAWIVKTDWEGSIALHRTPAAWDRYFTVTSACYD